VSVPFIELIFRDIRIEGSLLSSRSDSQKMLDLMSKNKIHVKTDAFYGIHRIPKLIEFAHSGKMAGKGVVIIDEEVVAKEQEDING
jgi:propanol-preferring alcohol dehydrogenase